MRTWTIRTSERENGSFKAVVNRPPKGYGSMGGTWGTALSREEACREVYEAVVSCYPETATDSFVHVAG